MGVAIDRKKRPEKNSPENRLRVSGSSRRRSFSIILVCCQSPPFIESKVQRSRTPDEKRPDTGCCQLFSQCFGYPAKASSPPSPLNATFTYRLVRPHKSI